MIIGLTGGIGAGKSAVADLFKREGAVVIDTDVIAREVVVPPSPVLDALAAEFGSTIIQADGTLDRRALAAAVFGDLGRETKLNAITHPAIRARTLALIEAQPPDAVVVVVVPLLFQSGFARYSDRTISVIAPADVRRRRLLARDGASESEIDARMAAQLPDAEYERRADVVIRNTGDVAALEREFAAAWLALRGNDE